MAFDQRDLAPLPTRTTLRVATVCADPPASVKNRAIGVSISRPSAMSITHAVREERGIERENAFVHMLADFGDLVFEPRRRMVHESREERAVRFRQLGKTVLGNAHAVNEHGERLREVRARQAAPNRCLQLPAAPSSPGCWAASG